MRRSWRKIKGVGFLVWHAKHYLIHVLLGLIWAWFLREVWREFTIKWIVMAVAGSIAPDLDHLLYFTTYGRQDPYTQAIITLIKKRQWRILVSFIEQGHKHNVNLMFHNFYILSAMIGLTVVSYTHDWRIGAVFLGGAVTHYIFDVAEDWVLLGRLNPNWIRWGRGKRRVVKFSLKDFS
jgi:hypothetical protein